MKIYVFSVQIDGLALTDFVTLKSVFQQQQKSTSNLNVVPDDELDLI